MSPQDSIEAQLLAQEQSERDWKRYEFELYWADESNSNVQETDDETRNIPL